MLAGAVGGSAIACGAAVGPLLGTVFDVASAIATAAIAAHAVDACARERGVSSDGCFASGRARDASQARGAPLAAHAIDVACRARRGDTRALRSAAILLGRATSARAGGIAFQLLASWCGPVRGLARVAAPVEVVRAALESAAFVRAMAQAVPNPVVGTAAALPGLPALEDVYEGVFGEELARADEAFVRERQERDIQPWEVAA